MRKGFSETAAADGRSPESKSAIFQSPKLWLPVEEDDRVSIEVSPRHPFV
jgi:hypothetical protein